MAKVEWKKEWKTLAGIITIFLACYYMPFEPAKVANAAKESIFLVQDYAREHVLMCLVPAFFIAGAISVFISQASVMKYLGARANKILAYGVASVSGTILAVCSCTILPLFAGIYRMGAGLGPATTFLYSGPAINVLAIVLTARVLGLELGVARAAGAVVFSILIGVMMHLIFRKEEIAKANAQAQMPEPEVSRPLWQNGLYFLTMVIILVFANWGAPKDVTIHLKDGSVVEGTIQTKNQTEITLKIEKSNSTVFMSNSIAKFPVANIEKTEIPNTLWAKVYNHKWHIAGSAFAIFSIILWRWFGLSIIKTTLLLASVGGLSMVFPENHTVPFVGGFIMLSAFLSTDKGELSEWFGGSWGFAKQILPLLFGGVIVAGLLLGRPGGEGLIERSWIERMVGGNSFGANLFASVAGAFMYFATLTEVPILQGLIGSGMGKGPALALLLAGPALSLPNMLVIRSVMGTKKTVVFVLLVIIMATISGMIFGMFF